MNRRQMLRRAAGAALLAPSCRSALHVRSLEFDALLLGGTLVDGTGSPPRRADVALAGGRVVEVGSLAGRSAALVVECPGKVVAPGFVDIHAHTNLLKFPGAESKLMQGVTLDVTGPDGGSPFPAGSRGGPRRFADWSRLHDGGSAAIHIASYIGHGSVRRAVLGSENRPPDAGELDEMRALVRESMEDGAVGLSSGLEYSPDGYASIDEVVALAEVAAEFGGVYSTHMRSEDSALEEAVDEAIEIGRRSGATLIMTHLKAAGRPNWSKLERVLEKAERARAEGQSVWADRYPYLAYSTGLSFFFPGWAHEGGALGERAADAEQRRAMRVETEAKVETNGGWETLMLVGGLDKAHAGLLGQHLHAAADARGVAPYELACELVSSESSAVLVGFGMDSDNTARILSLPWCAVASDGSAEPAAADVLGHPRSFGTFPRVLREYVRERRLLSLEEAVAKMTSLPAKLMGFEDRGRVATGMIADLVVFDPQTVTDRATYLEPRLYSEGIEWVFVGGVPTLGRGRVLGRRGGQVVRRG